MTRTKPTVADLLAGKGKVQRTNVLSWTVEEAAAAEAATPSLTPPLWLALLLKFLLSLNLFPTFSSIAEKPSATP